MPDFSPYMQYPTLDPESLRGTLISLTTQEPAMRGRPPGELDRAVSDVIAGQLVPAAARATAYQQVVAGFVAVLLRMAGANPSSILNELQARSVDDQLVLMQNILLRMVPEPAEAAPSATAPSAPATPELQANSGWVDSPRTPALGENGPAQAPAAHGRILNLGVNKHLAKSVEHEVPLRSTPITQRPAPSESTLVRLEVRQGVSIDVDESMQRFMRKPERRAEVIEEIVSRLEKYFGG
jgi:hypothetical protein